MSRPGPTSLMWPATAGADFASDVGIRTADVGSRDAAWLDLLGDPVLLVEPGGAGATLNAAAARRLERPEGAPRTIDPEAVLGTEAAAVLGELLARPADGNHRTRPVEIGGVGRHVLVDRRTDAAGRRLVALQPATVALTEVEFLEMLETLPVAVEVYDRQSREIFSNGYSAAMFGYDTADVPDLESWWEKGYPDPAYRAKARAAWFESTEQSRRTAGPIALPDWWVTCKDGSRKAVQFRIRAVGDNSVVVYWDVTARRVAESELRRLAAIDDLTGLANRRHFFAQAAACLAEPGPLSLLMIDIDHFKSVNDRFGHAAGDEVLRGFAGRCAALCGDALVARLGGEEFAVLAAVGTSGAGSLADALVRAVAAAPVVAGGLPIDITVSIGIATRGSGHDIDTLVERADRALYAAKNDGRGRYAVAPADAPFPAPRVRPDAAESRDHR